MCLLIALILQLFTMRREIQRNMVIQALRESVLAGWEWSACNRKCCCDDRKLRCFSTRRDAGPEACLGPCSLARSRGLPRYTACRTCDSCHSESYTQQPRRHRSLCATSRMRSCASRSTRRPQSHTYPAEVDRNCQVG